MRYILVCLVFLFPIKAFGLSVDTPLADSAMEARAKALFREIRCVVCQSEPLSDSPSDMAKTMRMAIRDQIASGMTDEEVKSYLVSRYGDFILMSPPFKPSTYLLWLGPLLIFSVALAMMLSYFRRQKA